MAGRLHALAMPATYTARRGVDHWIARCGRAVPTTNVADAAIFDFDDTAVRCLGCIASLNARRLRRPRSSSR